MKNLELYRRYKLTGENKKLFNIPDIEMIDGRDEVWAVCIFPKFDELTNKQRYLISNYGRIYDLFENVMVHQKLSKFFVSSKGSYCTCTIKSKIFAKYYREFLVHRLVMFSFNPPVDGRPIVNHIDGIPYHNYEWNLEWSNNSENYIHALKTGLKIQTKGEEQYNALWSDKEIGVICQMIEDGHKATFIYKALLTILENDPRVEYERIRTLYKHIIRKTHWKHISCNYDIDFSRYNYAKELGSVRKARERAEKRGERYEKDTIIFNSKAVLKGK